MSNEDFFIAKFLGVSFAIAALILIAVMFYSIGWDAHRKEILKKKHVCYSASDSGIVWAKCFNLVEISKGAEVDFNVLEGINED